MNNTWGTGISPSMWMSCSVRGASFAAGPVFAGALAPGSPLAGAFATEGPFTAVRATDEPFAGAFATEGPFTGRPATAVALHASHRAIPTHAPVLMGSP